MEVSQQLPHQLMSLVQEVRRLFFVQVTVLLLRMVLLLVVGAVFLASSHPNI